MFAVLLSMDAVSTAFAMERHGSSDPARIWLEMGMARDGVESGAFTSRGNPKKEGIGV